MIRVHFAEREPRDYDANEIEFTAAGAVVLRQVELREVVDPKDIRLKHRIPVGSKLLAAWSKDSAWVHVEELDGEAAVERAEAERENEPAIPPELEVYVR